MPELPEVEVHRRHLSLWLTGRIVVTVSLRPRAGLHPGTAAEELTTRLRGVRVEPARRWGKHLVVPTGAGGALRIHLGMTGHLSRRPVGTPGPRFSTLALELEDGHVVDLTDPRRFSKLGWLPDSEWPRLPELLGLGPDLLDAPPTPAQLRDLLARGRREIKVALMDQAVVAGLGNIHAAEALWRARIHPSRPAASLSLAEAARLCTGIAQSFQVVLDADDGEGVVYVEGGRGPNPFQVYGRRGEPCPRCAALLCSMVQGGRTTWYCGRCQPRSAQPARRSSAKDSTRGASARTLKGLLR